MHFVLLFNCTPKMSRGRYTKSFGTADLGSKCNLFVFLTMYIGLFSYILNLRPNVSARDLSWIQIVGIWRIWHYIPAIVVFRFTIEISPTLRDPTTRCNNPTFSYDMILVRMENYDIVCDLLFWRYKTSRMWYL